jgi:hypothetical protein
MLRLRLAFFFGPGPYSCRGRGVKKERVPVDHTCARLRDQNKDLENCVPLTEIVVAFLSSYKFR